jgi:hypothetical protein
MNGDFQGLACTDPCTTLNASSFVSTSTSQIPNFKGAFYSKE